MNVMPGRFEEIEKTIEGLYVTDTPLVAMDANGFHAAGFADNNGIYYFVSSIAKLLDLSPHVAINVFLCLLFAVGASIAIVSFFFLFKNWFSRFLATLIWLVFTTLCMVFWSDVYTANYFAISTTIPIFTLIKYHLIDSKGLWFLAIALSGLIIGYSNFIREHAGTTACVFISLSIILNQVLSKQKKTFFLSALSIFSLLPYIHENHLEKTRDIYLSQYQNTLSLPFPTWHLLYIGLGYLENDYGILRKDDSAAEKVRSINSEAIYCSKEYEEILKNEYWLILKSDPGFVIKTYLLKLLISCWMVIKYTNIGLILCFYIRPSWREFVPYLVAGAFGILPGVAAEPGANYILGTLVLGLFFQVHMIGLSIDKYRKKSRATLQYQRG